MRPEDLTGFPVGLEGIIRLPAWRPWYATPGFIGLVDAFAMRLAKGVLAHVPAARRRPELAKVHQAILEVVWNALIHGTRFVKSRRAHVWVRWHVTSDDLTVLIEDRGHRPFGIARPAFEDPARRQLMEKLVAMQVTGQGFGVEGLHTWADSHRSEIVTDRRGHKVGMRWYLGWKLRGAPGPAGREDGRSLVPFALSFGAAVASSEAVRLIADSWWALGAGVLAAAVLWFITRSRFQGGVRPQAPDSRTGSDPMTDDPLLETVETDGRWWLKDLERKVRSAAEAAHAI